MVRPRSILVVGAGLSGCSLARVLSDRGHRVSIIERESCPGGLCQTRTNAAGIIYEPFGAHVFHTLNPAVRNFVERFAAFQGYAHKKGMIINGRLFPFPLTRNAIQGFPEREQIRAELRARPERVDDTNFERAGVSIFGPTLYKYFIENYSRKMWGEDPGRLSAHWVAKRLMLREEEERLFHRQWEGLPVHGYSRLLENMIQGLPIVFHTTAFDPADYDVVALSAPIDSCLKYKFGELRYRSLRFTYREEAVWENTSYGTINLPQDARYIRKCNFAVFRKSPSGANLVQYQEAVDPGEDVPPMYYLPTGENERIFHRYLREICETNICPVGRLGLARYLDMDQAIAAAFDMVPVIEDYPSLPPLRRYALIQAVRSRYS